MRASATSPGKEVAVGPWFADAAAATGDGDPAGDGLTDGVEEHADAARVRTSATAMSAVPGAALRYIGAILRLTP
jgi:hypothetical protein